MRRTITDAEETEWVAQQAGRPPAITPRDTPKATRRRAYTVEELWERWAIFGSKYPSVRPGAEFLVWLER